MTIGKKALEELRIDRSRPQGKLPWGTLLAALVMLAVLAAAFFLWRNRQDAALVRTVPATASTQAGPKTVLNASGYVTARRQATVSSKVTGQIIEVLVEEGQKVQAGQIVARIDPANINTSLKLAEAQLEVSRVALHETQTQLEQARRELKRSLELGRRQISSQSEMDKAQAEADTLQARLDRQRQEVAVADRQVGYWQQQLEDTVIRAPFAGIVVSKNAQPGEIISPMSAGGGFTRTGICTIVDMASLEIEVDVNENYINRVEPSQRTEAILDAYSDWKIPCKVIAIIPTADRQKATVKVRLGFDKLDPRILPDMGVKVSFQEAGEPPLAARAATAPKAALRKEGGRDVIWIVREGRLERRAVKVGRTFDDQIEVLSDLAGGEAVVVEGPANLQDGGPVKQKNP